MFRSLTIKNIPDEVYKRLKASADAHRRSMNSEVIVCLETVLLAAKLSADERIARIREFRKEFGDKQFRHEDFDELTRVGRP